MNKKAIIYATVFVLIKELWWQNLSLLIWLGIGQIELEILFVGRVHNVNCFEVNFVALVAQHELSV